MRNSPTAWQPALGEARWGGRHLLRSGGLLAGGGLDASPRDQILAPPPERRLILLRVFSWDQSQLCQVLLDVWEGFEDLLLCDPLFPLHRWAGKYSFYIRCCLVLALSLTCKSANESQFLD